MHNILPLTEAGEEAQDTLEAVKKQQLPVSEVLEQRVNKQDPEIAHLKTWFDSR